MNTTAEEHPDSTRLIDAYLEGYQPASLSADDWSLLAPEAIALVKKAGQLTLTRVESDIQTIGRMAVHLRKTGRALTLDEALSDTALLDFDQALDRDGANPWSRAGHRSRLRRLQAIHRDAPWRARRRHDGERIADMPTAAALDTLRSLLSRADEAQTHGGEGLKLAVEYARRARRGLEGNAGAGPKTPYWRSARAFAKGLGVDLTRRFVDQAVTHEALQEPEPLVVIALTCRLSREDLDLGLTYAQALRVEPSVEHRALLRG